MIDNRRDKMTKLQRHLAVSLACGVLLPMTRIDAATALNNTGLDATPGKFVVCNGRVAFRTSESHQAMSDLNGDTEANDQVLHVVDLASGIATNIMLDASGPLACGGDLFAFGVSEANQGIGGTDLN